MENSFDPELLAYFKKMKEQLQKDHKEYLLNHPEIHQILSDYMSKLLLNKPEDVYKFTNEYFQNFEKESLDSDLKPILICAPSGCGKGTLVHRLIQDFPHYFEFSVSYTTRQPRQNDVPNQTYVFITKDQFKQEIDQGNFLEYVEHLGNYYGTNKKQLDEIRSRGKVCILDIELKGAKKIYQQNLDCNYFFMLPPSIEELRNRLINRNTETLQQIEKRITVAKLELEEASKITFFNQRMINDDFEKFYDQFKIWLQKIYPKFSIVQTNQQNQNYINDSLFFHDKPTRKNQTNQMVLLKFVKSRTIEIHQGNQSYCSYQKYQGLQFFRME